MTDDLANAMSVFTRQARNDARAIFTVSTLRSYHHELSNVNDMRRCVLAFYTQLSMCYIWGPKEFPEVSELVTVFVKSLNV